MSGWGYDESVFSTSWLRKVNVTVLEDEECDDDEIFHYDENDDYVYGVHSSQLCAGVLEGIEAPCYVDFGGPMIVSDPNINNIRTTI